MSEADAFLRQYKTRNILSMENRIKVIRAYKRNPNYQRLALQFGCSARQIKNIISKQNFLLSHYKQDRANKLADEVAERRQEKINFLGKVVYEYLLRALYLRVPVDMAAIRQKAFEIKEAIAIENFAPNNSWFQDFKATYNRFDLESLPNDMSKRQSLRGIDLVTYVSQQEREEKERQKYMRKDENCNNNVWEGDYSNKKPKAAMKSTKNVDAYKNNNLITSKKIAECDVSIVNDETILVKVESSDHEVDDRESGGAAAAASGSLLNTRMLNAYSNENSNSTPKQVAPLPPLSDIHSYLEALRHLKVLEDFAMIEENYRAIGLIGQLEQIFKNPPKLKRINT